MKNVLALVAFGVLVFATVGYFRGWYQFGTSPGPAGQNRVTIDINPQKVKQDLNDGGDKLKKILNKEAKKDNSSSTETPAPTFLPAVPPEMPKIPAVPPEMPKIPAAPLVPAAPPVPTPPHSTYTPIQPGGNGNGFTFPAAPPIPPSGPTSTVPPGYPPP